MTQDLISLLDLEFGDGQVDLVGHSLGELIACAAAATRPDLVHRLVLEDVGLLSPRAADPPSRPDGALPFDWQVVEQVRPEIDDFDPRWADVVAAIRAPTLVIAGGTLSHIPQHQVVDLSRRLRDGRMVTVKAGHLVHATEPEAFIRHLVDFLDGGRGVPVTIEAR